MMQTSLTLPPALGLAEIYDAPQSGRVDGMVSVIIPTFQRGYILANAIESVLGQTYRNFEILIVDDGSTDCTSEVVKRFGDAVRYNYQANAGVSAARNRALQLSQGEFIAFLDSDDQWLPWKLELQVAFLRQFPCIGMVWTDMSAIDDCGKVVDAAYLRTMYRAYRYMSVEKIFEASGDLEEAVMVSSKTTSGAKYYTGEILPAMLLGNLVHTSTVLLRHDLQQHAGDFDETITRGGEDYDFHVRTCASGKVALLDLPTILYRVGASDQLVVAINGLHFARSNMQTLKRWMHCGRQGKLSKALLRRRVADSYTWLGYEELKHGLRCHAAGHLLLSLLKWPIQPRAFALLACSVLPSTAFQWLRSLKAWLLATST